MKVLFTGSTARQTKDEISSRSTDRINDSTILVNSLRKSGHEVIRRPVQQGEDLSGYDLAIVGLGQLGSMMYCGEIMNALYAISAAPKVLIWHEDWKIDGAMKGLRYGLRDYGQARFDVITARLNANGTPFYGGVDHPKFNLDCLKNVARRILDGEFPALIPAFDWGDKRIVKDVLNVKSLYYVDHTPYLLEQIGADELLQGLSVHPELEEHVIASLANWDKWIEKQKLSWPVNRYGSAKGSQKLGSERDVFIETGRFWSSLCPEYFSAGSGWFRSRYVYSALNGQVLLMSPKDASALGIELKRVEELSPAKRIEYAEHQGNKILEHMYEIPEYDFRLNQIVMQVSA